MVEITAQMVKELREATGAGPKDCKTALEQHGGDMQKAIDYLREKGLAKAAKKLGAGRAMHEGLIESYIHFNKRMGALVEVNCETDFVAATEAFKTFTRDLALHIATAGPQYVTRDQVPAELVEAERDLQKRRAIEEGKPEAVAEKVAEGRMNKFFEDIVLMDQFFIKDDSKTISQLLQELVVEVGESVQINRFSRFMLGESAAAEGDQA